MLYEVITVFGALISAGIYFVFYWPDVEPYQLLRYHERRHQGRQAEDEEHVEDIAADHVAQRDVV